MISNFKFQISNFIAKLRALPETKKRIIFFVVMAIAALIVGVFGFFLTKNNIGKIGESVRSINLPEFNIGSQDLGINLPDMDFSNVSEGNQGIIAQNQTQNWKIYANDAYGFEIKYPENLSLKEVFNTHDFTSEKLEDNGKYPFWISFGTSNGKNIVEMTNPGLPGYNEVKSGQFMTDGISWNTIEGVNVENQAKGAAKSLFNAYTQKGNATYIFQCVNCNENLFLDLGKSRKIIFDQMLATFKFTSK